MIEELKKQAKLYVDANVNDGEDRSGSHDALMFTPDELQELINELIDDLMGVGGNNPVHESGPTQVDIKEMIQKYRDALQALFDMGFIGKASFRKVEERIGRWYKVHKDDVLVVD